jgi:glutathione S-transferase
MGTMVSKIGMDDLNGTQGIVLYGYPQCPFCARVLRGIDTLDLDIPLRNTMQDTEAREALVEAMGRGTVPVLRIEGKDGEVKWLPESADILRYLESRFG